MVAALTGMAGLAMAVPTATAWGSHGSERNSQRDRSATFGHDPVGSIGPDRFAFFDRDEFGSGGHDHAPGTLFVSTCGTDSGSCGRAWSPCGTIGQAVTNAAPGSAILVFPGSYAEMVTVTKPVSLRGLNARIDATGQNNGILLQGPGASNSKVSGFTVENSIGEGILASMVDQVEIAWNRVDHNDQGVAVSEHVPGVPGPRRGPGGLRGGPAPAGHDESRRWSPTTSPRTRAASS